MHFCPSSFAFLSFPTFFLFSPYFYISFFQTPLLFSSHSVTLPAPDASTLFILCFITLSYVTGSLRKWAQMWMFVWDSGSGVGPVCLISHVNKLHICHRLLVRILDHWVNSDFCTTMDKILLARGKIYMMNKRHAFCSHVLMTFYVLASYRQDKSFCAFWRRVFFWRWCYIKTVATFCVLIRVVHGAAGVVC